MRPVSTFFDIQLSNSRVKGHDGHPQNERCDTLATTAADGNDLIIDEGL